MRGLLVLLLLLAACRPTQELLESATTIAPPPGVPQDSSDATDVPILTQRVRVLSSTDRTFTTWTRVLIGEVRNDTTGNVQNATIVVTFFDGSGKVLSTAKTVTLLNFLAPGQRSPFRLVYDAPDPPARYGLQVEWERTGRQPLGTLSILSTKEHSADASTFRITGEIQNNSGALVTSVRVIGTFYAIDEHVVDVADIAATIKDLAPGAISTFDMSVEKRDATHYELQAHAE